MSIRSIGLLAICICIVVSCAELVADDPPRRDSILDWNSFALAAVVEDHSGTYGLPEQGGPTRTSRALGMIHAAMYDALNSVTPIGTPYLVQLRGRGGSVDAAVATAAQQMLVHLYPAQAAEFDRQHAHYLSQIPKGGAKSLGMRIGRQVAQRIIQDRRGDGSEFPGVYVPSGDPGDHNVDPLNPLQGFLTPAWGNVRTFAIGPNFAYVPTPPPALDSSEYAAAYTEVQLYGGDGIVTPTSRSDEQTEIGLFWAYDGARGIGVPPRLYNQIARVIASRKRNTESENARFFALINLAMADAGIVCWDVKYTFRFWRPVLGIRNGDLDGNDQTLPDPLWTPLGSPASNQSGNDFTPPFPAYSSGHATFGAAMFGIVSRFYGRDRIPFTFVSDELNGVTTDSLGNVRPLRPRHFTSLHAAALENARSRIYLGIHWQFDADEGVACGDAIADDVIDTVLFPEKLNAR